MKLILNVLIQFRIHSNSDMQNNCHPCIYQRKHTIFKQLLLRGGVKVMISLNLSLIYDIVIIHN